LIDINEFKKDVQRFLKIDYAVDLDNAKTYQKYNAISKSIMIRIIDDWNKTCEVYSKNKQSHYFSAEFLMGRALGNNLMNLGIYEDIKKALNDMNIDINDIEEIEEDAGIGNGGLGRLAACFMDSAATQNLPVTGYGIRYSYGLFKQSFKDGFQVESADNWLKYGDPWSIRCDEDIVTVDFSDYSVKAVPYDTPIIGYGTKNINKLRLFKAEPINEFDFNVFNNQKYDESVEEKNNADNISRVLYPNDSTDAGKILRLRQQYFFTSAALKDIIKKFKKYHGSDFKLFPKYNAIQLNDTHPVSAIPEFIRILTNEEGIDFEDAWNITVNTFSYTNHTIMREALEEWDTKLYKNLLPEVYNIIKKIDRRLIRELQSAGYGYDKINSMRIIYNGKIKMAYLAIYGSHNTNGVAEIHTNILKNRELKDWNELYSKRFLNITNGITPRRWSVLCNRELSSFITELLKSDSWITNLPLLKNLEKYADDKEVLKRFLDIKRIKKVQLAEYIKIHENINIDPDSIFDVQAKRLHEYKRQLLNAFAILDLYYRLKENPEMDIVPRTFIFGAKAAPGYVRAKAIIKYINEIAKLINEDFSINGKIKVVFIQNYGVSYGEKLFPAADISEQISTAGKEASGTGNMKLMLNGSPTIGTYDGANIEIVQEAGMENNFIFGARFEELEKIKENYDPKEYYNTVPGLKRVVNTLIDGTFDDDDTGMFEDLYNSLLESTKTDRADTYFVLKDFEDYRNTQSKVNEAYKDRMSWARKCWINIANAGKFSSDRSVKEYADKIWHIHPCKF
jgi:glycogen phosphorylase